MYGRETWLWAYWQGPPSVSTGLPTKWVRGCKPNTSDGRVELDAEVRNVWQGPYEVAVLSTRDPNSARKQLDDTMSQQAGSLDIAMKRFRWKARGEVR